MQNDGNGNIKVPSLITGLITMNPTATTATNGGDGTISFGGNESWACGPIEQNQGRISNALCIIGKPISNVDVNTTPVNVVNNTFENTTGIVTYYNTRTICMWDRVYIHQNLIVGPVTHNGVSSINNGSGITTQRLNFPAIEGIKTGCGTIYSKYEGQQFQMVYTISSSTGNMLHYFNCNMQIDGSLTVKDSVKAAGSTLTSDYRLKSNVRDIDEFTTLNLRPVQFEMFDKHRIGLIAHELQEHIPCVVTGEKDGKEMQSVNYIDLIPVLIKDLQRMNQEIKELKAIISDLRPQTSDLRPQTSDLRPQTSDR
jgi:hypothetical protein